MKEDRPLSSKSHSCVILELFSGFDKPPGEGPTLFRFRVLSYLTSRFFITLRGDVGGFGVSSNSSHITWNGVGTVGYHLTMCEHTARLPLSLYRLQPKRERRLEDYHAGPLDRSCSELLIAEAAEDDTRLTAVILLPPFH